MTLVPLPAYADNYIWMLHADFSAIEPDPVDAGPERNALTKTALQLAAILVTHHDADRGLGRPMSSVPTGRRVPLSRLPFLRSREATVIAAVREQPAPSAQAGEIGNIGAFAALRQWKNDLR